MKTTLQIGALILVMLVLTLAPVRTRIVAFVSPAVHRVERAVGHRFPTLIALHSMWEASSEVPQHPSSCGRGPFSAC